MNQKNKNFFFNILVIYSIVTLIIIILLVFQNRDLKYKIKRGRLPLPFLQVGDTLLPFNTKDHNENFVEISYGKSEKNKVFFVFSSSCNECNRMIPIWKSLNSKINTDKYEVWGVLINEKELSEKIKKELNNNFKVITFPNLGIQIDYKIFNSPITIVVNPLGKVEKIWRGEMDEYSFHEASKILWED